MRILIVEDELKTLNGIEFLIGEIGRNYEVIGKARNGLEGLELAWKEKPDVIITDIRMTVMSGLTMIKQLNEKGFACKYIIISGYADFEYAREALVLGSVDYLLKPMTKEMLLDVLKKAEQILLEETSSIRPLAFPTEQLLERVLFMQNAEGSKYAEALKKRYEKGMDLQLLLVKGDNRFVPAELAEIKKRIAACLKGSNYYLCTEENHKEVYVLLESKGNEDLNHRLDACVKQCRKEISEYIVFAGEELEDISLLIHTKQRMQDNANWNLTIKDSVVIRECIIEKTEPRKFIYPAWLERKIIKMIDTGEMEGIEEKIDTFLTYLEEQVYRYTDIREALICLTAAILYQIRTASYGLYENINNLNILEWVQNLLFTPHYRQIILNVLNEYQRFTNNIKKSSHPIINKVIKIIDAEYTKELSLEELAERMNITPEYLSSLFIKELGIKFTTYCTQRRIEAAKSLLSKKHLKIYEVALQCGYLDVKYFCKVFKKYTGVSPGEYGRT